MTTLETPHPLHILHLAASERWTGVAEPLTSVALEQQRLGHQVWLGCAPGYTFEEQILQRGLQGIDGLHLDRRMHLLHTLADLRLLPRFCRENHIDIVHCHLDHDHWLATTALRKTKHRNDNKPLIVRTIHGSAPPRSDFLHRRLYRRATDLTLCVGERIARDTERALRLPEGSILSIGGGVDLERFHPDADSLFLRKKMGIPLDAPVVGMVAHLRAGRGLRWLLRCVPQVLEQVPDAHIIIFGRGELYQWFKAEKEKPVYCGQLRWGSYLTQGLALGYAAMDVSVFLGLGSEASCRAILEAMASGRPTIGTDRGAVPEIIEDGVTGRVVRDRSEEELTAALIAVLSDRARAREMGHAARKRCEAYFTERKRAERVMEAYRNVLSR